MSFDRSKLNKDTQILMSYFEEKMKENTEIILNKISEKDAVIEELQAEVATLRGSLKNLEAELNQQKYEVDNLKNISNKDFLILSGPQVLKSDLNPAKIISSTLKLKTEVDVREEHITEAVKIEPKKSTKNPNPNPLYKFKMPYKLRTEVISKLATKQPQVYLNEALSPLKRNLLKRAKEVKAALPDKIKSTYFKNGVLRINEVEGDAPIQILNDVQLSEYLAKIDFSS